MTASKQDAEKVKRAFKAFKSLDYEKKVNTLNHYFTTMKDRDLSRLAALLEILILKDKNK